MHLPDHRGLTLDDAQRKLLKGIKKGTNCPCCGQYSKLYRRKLNSNMVQALIAIYHHEPHGWFHVSRILKKDASVRQRQYPKLRHWDLLKEHPIKRGYWRLTKLGRAFVRGRVRVRRFAVLYNNGFMGTEGHRVSIVDALGDHFDYNDLMKA